MTVILKATEPAELLSLIPALLGYAPRDSVVLLAFRGKRTCGTVRINLPSSANPDTFAQVALGAVGTVCKIPGADGIAFGVFTSDAFGAASSIPRSDFADILLDRIADSGLELKNALCRASDAWGSYLEDGANPLSELDDGPIAHLPEQVANFDGRDLPDRVPPAGPGQRRQMHERLDAFEAAVDRISLVCHAHPNSSDDEIERMLASEFALMTPTLDFGTFAEQALGWTPAMLDDGAAMLLYGITRPQVRDDTMVQWAFGMGRPARERGHRRSSENALGTTVSRNRGQRRRARSGHGNGQVIGHGEPSLGDIGDRMTGFGPRPDPDRMLRAIDILLYLIARAEGRDRLAPLCMVAWLSWGLGRASHAAKYLGEARAIDPTYVMGEVLMGVFTVFPLPEWAFASPSS